MNKKEFIKELTKKLQVLEENEIKDIIDEYSGIIDEKVKHGKKEEEAVKDFGDISELAEEILSAYKINPNYKNDSVKNIVNDCEVLIKKGASKLTDFSKKVAEDLQKDDSKFNIETMFEIIIKVFILLLIFALIRIPFDVIFHLGSGLLGIAFYPLDVVLIAVWQVIIIIANLLCCVLIFIAMFKRYFYSSEKSEKVVRRHTTTKTTVKKKIKNETGKEEYKEEKNSNYEGSITRVVMAILKVFVVICFIIPLVFTNIGIYIALSVVIFAVIKGIEIIGLAILLAGLAVIVSHILSIIYDSVFNHRKIYSFPFIIGTVLMVIGGLVFFEEALNFNYNNSAPETKFAKKTVTYEERINKDTDINVNFGSKSYIEDNDLEDNQIVIEVTYFKDLIDAEKVSYNDGRKIVIDIDHKNYNYHFKMNREMYKLVISNLKDNEIYNYSKLFQTNVKIYANSKTMDLIK
ncbi:MAG: DUF1700 domain-containing protein [Ignavibacteriales bacterium]